ncbi:MAG: IclR family transcriptional regulator [Armatimonadota bacterium]|nr:IclR family transcriptional regulator [Armatimonadota bacterium]
MRNTTISLDSPAARPARVRSVDRALALLDLFAERTSSWGISELAQRTGLSKASVFRLLQSLTAHGYTVRDSSHRYVLGMKPLLLARALLRRHAVAEVAEPRMAALARRTGESVVLTIDGADGVVCLAAVDSTQPLRLSVQVGHVTPYHAGATGKVHLAHLPPERQQRVLARRLRRYTPRTVTDPAALRRQLAEIRRRGYAISLGELDSGVAAVAVPVPGPDGTLAAVLSLAGPASRFTTARLPALLTETRQAAGEIARALAARTAGADHAGNGTGPEQP